MLDNVAVWTIVMTGALLPVLTMYMKLSISSTSETCSYQTPRSVLPCKLVYFIILRRILTTALII